MHQLERVGIFGSYEELRSEIQHLDRTHNDPKRTPAEEQRMELLFLVDEFLGDRDDRQQLLPLFADLNSKEIHGLRTVIFGGDLDSLLDAAKTWSELDTAKLMLVLKLLKVPREKIEDLLKNF